MATTDTERARFARLDRETLAAAIEAYTGEYNVYPEVMGRTDDELWEGFATLSDGERDEFWCAVGAIKLLDIVEG